MRRESWALAASALAGLALAGFFAAPVLLRGPPRDAETLCLESGAVGHTLVLVDKSDPWSEVQAERLKRLVKRIGEELPAERKLSIYVFNDEFEPNFPPLMALCNPGRKASELIGNPRREYLRWRERFGKPLDEALAQLARPNRGQQSPIVEAVGDVLARGENRPAAGDGTLVLVSDMLQNSAQSSLFGSGPNRDPERLKRALARAWPEPAKAGWRLEVRQVQGTYEAQRLEQAQAFWQPLLRALAIAFGWERL